LAGILNNSPISGHQNKATPTGAVFAVLPKRIKKKKGKGGERRGKGEGEKLES